MKKLGLIVLSVGVIALSSCGIKNIVKNESPEDVIKTWQKNLVESMKSNVLTKQNLSGSTDVSVKVNTPVGNGDLNINMNSKGIGSTGEANMDFITNFDIKAPQATMNGTISGQLDMVVNPENIYLNLKKLGLKSSNPQLMIYNQMVGMMKNKWFYIPKQQSSKDLEKVIKNISFKDEFSKLSMLKVNKKLGDYKYEVSLDKKNISQIIYDISKKIDKNYSGSVEQIQQTLGSGDINGVLSIDSNKKYFDFSGDLIRADGVKIPLELKFKENKLYLNSMGGKFLLDLNRNGDNFDGIASFKDSQLNEFKLKLSGTLSENKVVFNALFNENGVSVDFKVNGEYKEIEKIDVKIPTDAIPLSDLGSALGGGNSVPVTPGQGDMPSNTPVIPGK